MKVVQQKSHHKAKVIEIHPQYSKLQKKVVRRALFGEYRILIYGVVGGLLLAGAAITISHFSK